MKNLSGTSVRKIFVGGYGLLDKNKAAVDALNVFPVPDGDTGINMALTLKSVIKELDNVSSNEVTSIGEAIARGALRGARGNSGVILSQILKGMMTEISTTKVHEEVNTKTFARAMEKGANVAYKAVTVPREGTILTVIRYMAEEAKKISKNNDDFVNFFEKVIQKGEEILAQTPEMLPALKKAGVVDAGGRGLIIMFTGFLAALRGEEAFDFNFEKDTISSDEERAHHFSDPNTLADIEYAYCVEFNIAHVHKSTTTASVDSLANKLMQMGDSVLVTGDIFDKVKVHLHTNTPGEALTAAIALGEIVDLKIDNMLEQLREFRTKLKISEKDQGLVAVAAGEGLINVFKDLGCDYVIKGGQTMNPSADDIAEAVRRVNAKNIFIFPNNKNIILAAKHAQALVEKNIIVIPTKSINEGISACIAFNPETTVEENTELFLAAIECVKSAAVTYAVRSTKLDRFEIKQGEVIGLTDKTILAKGATPNAVAAKLIDKLMDENVVNVTLFFGADVREKDAFALQDKLAAKYPNCEINTVSGGQPVYYYLISLE